MIGVVQTYTNNLAWILNWREQADSVELDFWSNQKSLPNLGKVDAALQQTLELAGRTTGTLGEKPSNQTLDAH
ncbi:protein of unknown function [Ectopseudomonas oleovorans]|nr:protein of unknown function [Pseudomonas oleovorans]